jgi:hypothetical protein
MLNNLTRNQVITRIQRLTRYHDKTKGFFNDTSWKAVTDITDSFINADIELLFINSYYSNDGQRKNWNYSIKYGDNKQLDFHIIASILDNNRYDLTAYFL